MRKIEKQILFEIKQELSESILDRAVGAVTGSIPGKVAGSVKDMVLRNPEDNQAKDLEQKQLLQKRFEPFQYPVSLMIGKFNIYKKEAEEAAKAVDGEDPKNKAQLVRKAEIYGAITDKILTPLSDYIDQAAEAADFAAFNTLTTDTLGADNDIPKAIEEINSKYGLSIPPMMSTVAFPTGPSKQASGAAAKLGTVYADKDYTKKDATLQEERNIKNEKAYLDLIIKQLKELLRPLALLVQKKGKETRTKITQTDLVQALDAKGIKENRNEIIQLIVSLSQAKGGDFDIQEFLKDPIGQSKKWLESSNLEESNGNETAETKKNLALKIAMAYYSKKLEPIIANLPKDIAKDSDKLTTIKQKLAKAFIIGSNTEDTLKIELTADEKMEFNWTGTTFQRVIKGWERFLKTKGMEGFQYLTKFAKMANAYVANDQVDNFIKDPGPWMKQMATDFYTSTDFNPDNETVTYKLSEQIHKFSDESGDKKQLRTFLYFFAAHKYSKILKPLIIKLNKYDENIDADILKKQILPNVLLSYLKGELKAFKVTVGSKDYNFAYTAAGSITVKGFRELEDWQKDVVEKIKEYEAVFEPIFNLQWRTNKGNSHMLHKMLNTKEDQPADLELKFTGKKDIIGPYFYLYNLAVIMQDKPKIKQVILDNNRNVQTETFSKMVDTYLREFFEFSNNPKIFEKGDQELYKKTIKFLNSELKPYWDKKNDKPEISSDQEPYNPNLSENIDRKLELLINNYINNRKQKWQRKIM